MRTVLPETVTNGRWPLVVSAGTVMSCRLAQAPAPRGSRQNWSDVSEASGPTQATKPVPAALTARLGLEPAPSTSTLGAGAAAVAFDATGAATVWAEGAAVL